MTTLTGNPAGEYMPLRGWVWWTRNGDMPEMCTEGWKLHIGYSNSTQAQAILNEVMHVARQMEVSHKFVPNTDVAEKQSKSQYGKWLVVYPRSILSAFVIVNGIDDRIKNNPSINGLTHNDVRTIPADLAVGDTIVFTRYGGFQERMIRDATGSVIPETTVGKKLKPDWINNPWPEYADFAEKGGNPPHSWTERFPIYDLYEDRD